jgi:orotate phosphoribosyltransferase
VSARQPTLDTATFVADMIAQQVLVFGDFTLKSGRSSPYFFNLGAIDSGAALLRLGAAYAAALVESGLRFDVVFGPAYKGIPIAVAAGMCLSSKHGRDVGVAFNRKEAKNHGEGGRFVGADVSGRVVLVDDVLTAGTAVSEAASLVREAGGEVVGVLVALDRQERLDDGRTAVDAVAADLGVGVSSITTLQGVIDYLDSPADSDNYQREALGQIRRYQQTYCVIRDV